MYSAYKLNKQGDNKQPWRTPFQIWNLSVVPYPVLTVASLPVHRFLRRQVRWSGIPISLRIFSSLWWSITVILVNISVCGYEKNEASRGRVGAGRRVRKPSKWSSGGLVAWTRYLGYILNVKLTGVVCFLIFILEYTWVQMIKNLPAMWETCVWSLGWEDPLEEGMATHSSILAWRIPMDRRDSWATAHGVGYSPWGVGHDWVTKHSTVLNLFTSC